MKVSQLRQDSEWMASMFTERNEENGFKLVISDRNQRDNNGRQKADFR